MAFSDESYKLFVGRFLLPEEIEPWIIAQNMGSLPATRGYDHHTYKPMLETWRGLSTLEAIFSYYHNQLGWPQGVGPHFFVTDKGVWVATHPRHDGIGVAGNNHRTIHAEIVGYFDQKPTEGKQLITLYILKHALARNPGIPISRGYWRFHRDDAPTTCPGTANTKEHLIDQAALWLPKPAAPENIRRAITRLEFAEALFSKGLPAVFKGPYLRPTAAITRYEVKVLVERAYSYLGMPTPDVIHDGRLGDPLMEHELSYVLQRLV